MSSTLSCKVLAAVSRGSDQGAVNRCSRSPKLNSGMSPGRSSGPTSGRICLMPAARSWMAGRSIFRPRKFVRQVHARSALLAVSEDSVKRAGRQRPRLPLDGMSSEEATPPTPHRLVRDSIQ